MWEDLLQITDAKARDAQLRKIGNYKFENFETIPLFNTFIEVIVDPKVVADWPFPGWDGATSVTRGESRRASRRSPASSHSRSWVNARVSGTDVANPSSFPPRDQPVTQPYQRWLGLAPSSRYAIFIRLR